MNALFTDTITVYNHYIDSEGNDKWSRKVVKHVQWKDGKTGVVNDKGILTATATKSITIDFSSNKQQNFLIGAEYERTEQPTKHWTLNPKDEMDVLVHDECLVEITDEFTITNLIKEYGAVTVKAVSDNRNRRLLPTIKVVAQ